MVPLDLEFTVLTPTFSGGADPNDHSELRAPSVKGALRFWYRAADPRFRKLESEVFGSADGGQAPFGLAMPNLVDRTAWNTRDLRDPFPGLAYLGYSHDLGQNRRKYLLPNAPVPLRVAPKRRHKDINDHQRRAWVAALWLWGTFGGLGSRSRRGFGSVQLRWPSGPVDGWPELECLQLAPAETPQQWGERARHNLETIRKWFGPWSPGPCHPRIAEGFRAAIATSGGREWKQALESAGQQMVSGYATGRPRTSGRRRADPDYTDVKAHFVYHGATGLSGQSAPPPARLAASPVRAAFGLPLTFRYRSLQNGPREVQFEPADGNRWPSPLHLGMARIGNHLHPVYCLLDAAPPTEVRLNTGETVPGPNTDQLQRFLEHVSHPSRGFGIR